LLTGGGWHMAEVNGSSSANARRPCRVMRTCWRRSSARRGPAACSRTPSTED